MVRADPIQSERLRLGEDTFVELVIWKLPAPARGSRHSYKYRLALVANDLCVLRYDNEAGKGDHKHLELVELPYAFTTIEQLRLDFMRDVRRWLDENGGD